MGNIDVEVSLHDDKYVATIKHIRARNFSNNLPFLILSDKLPEGQVYREFADGHIELQEVSFSGSTYQSKSLQTLTAQEADKVRQEYGLL